MTPYEEASCPPGPLPSARALAPMTTPCLMGSVSQFWLETWSEKASRLADAPLHVVDGYQFMSADAYARMVRAVVAPMGLSAGQRLVEVGCGAGAFLAAVERGVPDIELHGIDISPAMVDLAARRLPHGHFRQGDIRDLRAVPDAAYDHAAAFAVLCYLDSLTQATRALDELLRIVRPGGCVVLGDTSDARHRRRSEAFLEQAWATAEIPAYQYFEPEWFAAYARERGATLVVTPMATLDLPEYAPRRFRFSVYLWRAA